MISAYIDIFSPLNSYIRYNYDYSNLRTRNNNMNIFNLGATKSYLFGTHSTIHQLTVL